MDLDRPSFVAGKVLLVTFAGGTKDTLDKLLGILDFVEDKAQEVDQNWVSALDFQAAALAGNLSAKMQMNTIRGLIKFQ